MKLLLDQGLPWSTAQRLRESGIDAIHVSELGMSAAPDEALIEFARAHGYSIVTLDADFHALLATAAAARPSVIRLRRQRLQAPEAARLVGIVLERLTPALEAGCFITVTKESIRVRKLPIRRRE